MPRAPRLTETREQYAATRYTARWHRVEAWAREVVPGDVETVEVPSPRTTVVRGSLVDDHHDYEEAMERARGVEWFGDLDTERAPLGVRGPTIRLSGIRRTLIRVFCWVYDEIEDHLSDPQWITTGEGMTPAQCARTHNAYIRAYSNGLLHGLESRRLKGTAMEVAFWTTNESAAYV